MSLQLYPLFLLYGASAPFGVYLREFLFAVNIRAVYLLHRAAAPNVAAVAACTAAAAESFPYYLLALLSGRVLDENGFCFHVACPFLLFFLLWTENS